jgi:hypothetical protein
MLGRGDDRRAVSADSIDLMGALGLWSACAVDRVLCGRGTKLTCDSTSELSTCNLLSLKSTE